MKPTLDPDWADLGSAWQGQEADVELSEQELAQRLRRQRILARVVALAEGLSLIIVLGVALWMSRDWLAEPGASPILILLLLVPTGAVVWLRRRQRSAPDSGLEGIDATLEREQRLLESIRLGHVASQLALAGLTLAAVMALRRHALPISAASLAGFAVLFCYVFGLQVALIVWTLRVERRRRRLGALRRALHPPE